MNKEEKKVICMIGAFPPPVHGQAIAFETLAESPELLSRFHIIKVDYAPKKRLNRFLMVPYKMLRNLRMVNTLKNIITKNKVDLFYLSISSSKQGAIRDYIVTKTIMPKLGSSKLIIHHHGGNFREFYGSTDKKYRTMVDYYLKETDRIIVLTPKLKHLFEGLVPADKIRVVSNGICSTDRLSDEVVTAKIDSLKTRKCIHILYLSNLIRTKGFFELLQSVPLLLKQGVEFDITFAGAFRKKSDENEFYDYIQQNQVEHIVKYSGIVTGPQKSRLLAESDIFVLPTSYPNEGQPISILEAMSSGMAVVTTDRGGITDVVHNYTNGTILNDVTPNTIANAVKLFFNDRELLVRICKMNRKIAEDNYMEEHYVQRMIEVFNEVFAE